MSFATNLEGRRRRCLWLVNDKQTKRSFRRKCTTKATTWTAISSSQILVTSRQFHTAACSRRAGRSGCSLQSDHDVPIPLGSGCSFLSWPFPATPRSPARITCWGNARRTQPSSLDVSLCEHPCLSGYHTWNTRLGAKRS